MPILVDVPKLPDYLSVIEVDDAGLIAGALFRSRFGDEIPTYPRHFVCLYKKNDEPARTAGYIHFSYFETVYLGGGLVVDEKIYRYMPPAHRSDLAAHGSLGQLILSASIAKLTDANAVFVYIGDAKSRLINERAGFALTHVDKLFALWRSDTPHTMRVAIAERVGRLVPF